MIDEVGINDLPWGSTPMLFAGVTLYIETLGPIERLKWRFKGVKRYTYEIGIRTSRGNEYAFIGADEESVALQYMDILQKMTPQQFADHFSDLDKVDEELGYPHKPSDALLVQWKEICYAWADVVPGDYVFLIQDQPIETVEGKGILPAGTSFSVSEVLFDENHSVLSHSTTGDVVAVPWRNYKLIAKGPSGSGRMSNGHYVYARNKGYVPIKEGTYVD
jgi:hypothetical protein